MATYNTKFNIGDTAYFADPYTLNVISGVVVDLYIHHTTLAPEASVTYRLRYDDDFAGKATMKESELSYIEEAKAVIVQLLSERNAQIANLG